MSGMRRRVVGRWRSAGALEGAALLLAVCMLRDCVEGMRTLPAWIEGGTVLPDVETSWVPAPTVVVAGATTASPALRTAWVLGSSVRSFLSSALPVASSGPGRLNTGSSWSKVSFGLAQSGSQGIHEIERFWHADERALAWMPRRSPARTTVDVIALIVSDCADNS